LKERTKTVSNMQRGPRKHYSLSGKSHDQFRDPAHRAVELDLTSSSWFHVPAAKNRVSVVSQVVNRMKKHSHAHTHAQKEKKRVSRCLSSHLSHITRSDRHLYPMRKERKKESRATIGLRTLFSIVAAAGKTSEQGEQQQHSHRHTTQFLHGHS
jgi:hypothetical protein